jgi:hypothetical protein
MLRKRKPSWYLRRSLGGHGFAVDDLVSIYDRDPEYADVIEAVLEISRKHSGPDYLIGMSNPAAEFDILALTQKLEAEGR